jgi:hypothetical protein
MSNKEATAEKLLLDQEYTSYDYDEAHQHTLYLPYSDAKLSYVSWCTSEELRMATMFGFF